MSLEEVLALSPSQMLLLQKGLNKILIEENGRDSEAANKVDDEKIKHDKTIMEERLKSLKESGKAKVGKDGKIKVDPFKIFG